MNIGNLIPLSQQSTDSTSLGPQVADEEVAGVFADFLLSASPANAAKPSELLFEGGNVGTRDEKPELTELELTAATNEKSNATKDPVPAYSILTPALEVTAQVTPTNPRVEPSATLTHPNFQQSETTQPLVANPLHRLLQGPAQQARSVPEKTEITAPELSTRNDQTGSTGTANLKLELPLQTNLENEHIQLGTQVNLEAQNRPQQASRESGFKLDGPSVAIENENVVPIDRNKAASNGEPPELEALDQRQRREPEVRPQPVASEPVRPTLSPIPFANGSQPAIPAPLDASRANTLVKTSEVVPSFTQPAPRRPLTGNVDRSSSSDLPVQESQVQSIDFRQLNGGQPTRTLEVAMDGERVTPLELFVTQAAQYGKQLTNDSSIRRTSSASSASSAVSATSATSAASSAVSSSSIQHVNKSTAFAEAPSSFPTGLNSPPSSVEFPQVATDSGAPAPNALQLEGHQSEFGGRIGPNPSIVPNETQAAVRMGARTENYSAEQRTLSHSVEPSIINDLTPSTQTPDSAFSLHQVEQSKVSVQKELSVSVVSQVKGAIESHASASRSRESTLTIRLDPPELGVVIVDFDNRGDSIKISMRSDSPVVRQILDQDIKTLVGNLEQNGVSIDDVDVSQQRQEHFHQNRDANRNSTDKHLAEQNRVAPTSEPEDESLDVTDPTRIDIKA